MSAIDNMKTRLQYYGGNAEGRMINDKLRSLKKALLYSYQSATIDLYNDQTQEYDKTFRCLINPDKLKPDYDNKILSIPYEDIQLNEPTNKKTNEGLVPTLINPGDVFYWRETDTYWIVYLNYREERAYFRAEIRKCDLEIEINKHKYKVYYRGPVETTIQWNQKSNTSWNDLNYSAIIYVTKNEETEAFFHRFQLLKIRNQNWEVAAVDDSSGEGILEVQLAETYNNTIKDNREIELTKEKPIIEIDSLGPYIEGPKEVKPYSTVQYYIKNSKEGEWELNTSKAKFLKSENNCLTIEITTGRSGTFDLVYKTKTGKNIVYTIKIISI